MPPKNTPTSDPARARNANLILSAPACNADIPSATPVRSSCFSVPSTPRRTAHPTRRGNARHARPTITHQTPRRKPGIGNANYAWIQHFIHYLTYPNGHGGGTAGFIMANGSLCIRRNRPGDDVSLRRQRNLDNRYTPTQECI